MLICPVCASALIDSERSLCCAKGHRFDLAASGYCNLLTGTKAGKYIGDNKDMVAARRRFLESNTYRPLRDAVCQNAKSLTASLPALQGIDCGCGEGYYTRAVTAALKESGKPVTMVGVDISKAAVQYAAKRDKETRYIAASSYHLPVADRSANLILSLFAPTPSEEFHRILAPGGKILQVVPGAEHLWELKQAVYDTPYPNQEDKHQLDGFLLEDRQKLTVQAHLTDPELIQALFAMTPYAHRTPRAGMERLHQLTKLTVSLSFLLLTYGEAN